MSLLVRYPDSEPYRSKVSGGKIIVPPSIPAPIFAAGGTGTFVIAKDPSQISGLNSWYKADALQLNDGDPVSSWTDSSTNNNPAIQATSANQPTYHTNVVNGKPVVRFDGVNDWLESGNNNLSQPYSILIVSKSSVTSSFQPFMSTNTAFVKLGMNFGNYLFVAGNNSLGDAADHSGAFHDFEAVGNGASSTGYVDGTNVGTIDAGSNSIFDIDLGHDQQSGAYLTGDIAEVLVYNSVLSVSSRLTVEGYLVHKYSLSGVDVGPFGIADTVRYVTASSGSFSVTGGAAKSIRFARATGASFVVSDGAAIPLRVAAGATGTFNVTGNLADSQRRATASTGTYTVTGNAANS